MLKFIKSVFWGSPVGKVAYVLTGLFLLPAWVFNYENWLSVNGYDKLLTDSESPVLEALGWLAGFLASPQPRWFISGAMIALIAEGLWRFLSSRDENINPPVPEVCETPKLGDEMISHASGSAWALGMKVISIKHAACAFASISPDKYKSSAKAQAIYNQIKSSAEIGYIPTVITLERSTSRVGELTIVRTQINDSPWKNERINDLTMIPVVYIYRHFQNMPWDFSWIIKDSDVSGQSPLNIVQETQP